MRSIYIAFALFGAFCTVAGICIGFMISAYDEAQDRAIDKAITDGNSAALEALPD